MANEGQTQKIRDALAQLDPANKDHWTDDGLPRTAMVQRIAADQTITRKDIQAAAPHFARPGTDIDPLTGEPAEQVGHKSPDTPGFARLSDTELAEGTGETMTEDEVRAVLQGRVDEQQAALDAARQKINDGHAEVAAATSGLNKARAELARAFPPLTPAENIKQFIQHENEKRAQSVGAAGVYQGRTMPASQLDAAMGRGNSRGWKRPTRMLIGNPQPPAPGAPVPGT